MTLSFVKPLFLRSPLTSTSSMILLVPLLKKQISCSNFRGNQYTRMMHTYGFRYLWFAILVFCALGPLGQAETQQEQQPRRSNFSNQEVLAKLLEMRNGGDVDGALRFLSDALDQRAKSGSQFRGLYVKVWREAQVGSGRLNADWAASLYNQLFISCETHQYFTEMNDVMGNLLSSLDGAGRHGRKKEILEWWAGGPRAAGERLDSSKYQDLGPALHFLPEVRKRNIPAEVLYWRAKSKQSRSISKVDLGQKNSQLFNLYAGHFGGSGRWAESLEWYFQVLHWASHEDGSPRWQLIQPWFEAVESIADWLRWHGFYEEGIVQVDLGLAAPMQESYHGRCNITLSMVRLDLLMDLERAPEDVVKQAEDLARRAAANRHLSIGSHRQAKVLLARALLHKGRDSEALKILDELSEIGFFSARTKRLNYWIEKGMLERVEEELILLLTASRESGNKSSEAWLYEKYADFLDASGRLAEALSMRREVIRLYKSFNHFTKVPGQLIKLALLLESMGDLEGSRTTVAEARALLAQGRLPAGRLKIADSLLTQIGQKITTVDTESEVTPQVDFQPKQSIVIPIEGAAWTTILTLSNPSGRVEEGTLMSRGLPMSFSMEGELDEIVVRSVKRVAGEKTTLDLRLEPQTYELIRITSDKPATDEGEEVALIWTSADGKTKVEALVQIEAPEEGVSSSIIQAGNYRSNPFYSVPMHFHYVSTEDAQQSVPMRFVASQEARVEIYAMDGTPLSVDAKGNGSLWDRGDELFGAGDGKGNLRMSLERGAASFMVLVYPTLQLPKEGLNLNIEVYQDGEWLLNSQNSLMP